MHTKFKNNIFHETRIFLPNGLNIIQNLHNSLKCVLDFFLYFKNVTIVKHKKECKDTTFNCSNCFLTNTLEIGIKWFLFTELCKETSSCQNLLITSGNFTDLCKRKKKWKKKNKYLLISSVKIFDNKEKWE